MQEALFDNCVRSSSNKRTVVMMKRIFCNIQSDYYVSSAVTRHFYSKFRGPRLT